MEAYGVPGYLLYPAAALEIGSGGMLLAAYHPVHTVWLAMVLAGWCLLTASIFHTDLTDQEQKINFMKNMATPGGGRRRLVLAEEKPGRDKRNEVSGEGMKMGGGGCAGMRSGEKVRWTPRWATWLEALAAGPEVFADTKERLDVCLLARVRSETVLRRAAD
jgi:hypothetical protein